MDLYQAVRQATTNDEVIAATRRWIEIEFTGVDCRTRVEQRAQLYESTAGSSNSSHRTEVLAAARDDADIWEGLRRYALQQAETGHPIEPSLAVLLLSGSPKRKRGRQDGGSPLTENLNMIYARAVWSIYHAGAGRYTLESSGKGTNNAFALVEQAAKPITGATFDEVRNASTKEERDRLTRIYMMAQEAGLTGWHPGLSLHARGK